MPTRTLMNAVLIGALSGGLLSGAPALASDSFFDGVLDLSLLDGTNGFVINGANVDDRSGRSVASAGDLNGDGIGDLTIGAPGANANDRVQAGQGYVVFGSGGVGAGGTLNLSSLNGTNGFVLNGVGTSALLGESVSSAGDVNNDGIGDLIIGSPKANPNDRQDAGQSYVVFGGGGVGAGGSLDLALLNGDGGFAINGANADDRSGGSVSSAGDVNGDGIGDLIIGARLANGNDQSDSGQSYVVFGGGGVGSGGTVELVDLDGANGFAINGASAGDESGTSVSFAGDINNDGIGDLIIGAPGIGSNSNAGAGKSYVVFGGQSVGTGGTLELADLNGANGFALNGVAVDDRSGYSVSSAGDVNGDGIGDLIIGAFQGGSNAGESYVVFGGQSVGTGGTLELANLDGTDGFVLNGINSGDLSGISVSSAGDVNLDGIDDLIIGALWAEANGNAKAGQSYVVFGELGLGADGVLELADLDGTNGFVLNGIGLNDNSGVSVVSAGDVNGDGIGDLIIGAMWAHPNDQVDAGQSYVVFGVPEPGSAALLGLGSLAVMRRRPRNN